jgi:hypothetical protein
MHKQDTIANGSRADRDNFIPVIWVFLRVIIPWTIGNMPSMPSRDGSGRPWIRSAPVAVLRVFLNLDQKV